MEGRASRREHDQLHPTLLMARSDGTREWATGTNNAAIPGNLSKGQERGDKAEGSNGFEREENGSIIHSSLKVEATQVSINRK